MEHSIIDIILNGDEFHEKLHREPEYYEAFQKMNKSLQKFKETLTDEQKKVFDELENSVWEEHCMKNENYFRAGVKVGVRLVAECMFD